MTFSPRARQRLRLALALTLVASPALAQTTATAGGDLGGFIQNIINLMNSTVIKGLATLAVIICGGAWLLGHLDLRRAATVILGIVVMFSAAAIVGLVTGGGG